MTVLDTARLIIYRVHEKGIEILLEKESSEKWKLPEGLKKSDLSEVEHILLEDENGDVKTIALEADWHEIPSIKALISYDVNLVKEKIKNYLPLEKGTYVAIKEACKYVLPEEYKMIKELKEVLVEKHLLRSI